MRKINAALSAATFIALIITAHALAVLPEAKNKKFRIFHVMSYHSPWRWTDGLLEGFKEPLADLNVEYRVFQMDTKRNSDAELKEKKGREARGIIDAWKPDLVYTTDDDAQEYVAKYYINKGIPFVFSAVNKSPKDYGFEESTNITGILEHEHFVESVTLLREIVPEAGEIALIFDDASMWNPVIERIRARKKQLSGIEIAGMDIVRTFREYKEKVAAYQKTAHALGIIGIFNFKDETGKNVPYQDVLRWTAENSKLPDFSFWVDRVHYGTLCAVTISEREQGLAAGEIARGILAEGKSPANFAFHPTTKGIPVISLARAQKLGLKIKASLLLSSEIVKDFDWDAKE